VKEPNAALYTVIGVISVTLLCAYVALSIVLGAEFAIPALITGGVVTAIGLRGQVGKALAERIHSGPVGPAEVPPEVLEEMDEMRHRMLELEERLDFTERVLARQRAEDPAQLPPG
jgi:hypothetical protein